MNLRTLKKLSKRAAPYLPLLDDHREQFRAERDENYHGLIIRARKHWERLRVHPSHREERSREWFIYTSRAGHRVRVSNPCHPRKGTIMVGAMQGYYEPEWSEETAYGALRDLVYMEFTDWDVLSDDIEAIPGLLRPLSTPTQIFAAADELANRRSAA